MMVALGTVSVTLKGGTQPELIDLPTLKRHPLLGTAASKLQWAQGHLAALDYNIGQVFADPMDHAVLSAQVDLQTGYHVLRIESMPDMSGWAEDFEHSVADVATNTRSALDKLAWKSACASANGTPSDVVGVKFPICDTPEDWIGAGRARNLLVPEHCGFIQSFQPCEGQGPYADSWWGSYVHPLTLLRDLANDDKHRDTAPVLLVPTQFSFRNFEIADTAEGPPDWQLLNIEQPMEVGLPVLQVRFIGAEPYIHDAARAMPYVALAERRGAVVTLQRLHRFVHLILSEFARKFPSP